MTGAMNHRGPDSKNFHLGPDYSIGHNRLSIIDRIVEVISLSMIMKIDISCPTTVRYIII